MSVSERQTDLDEVVDSLADRDEGDTVTLVTDAGSFTATVTAVEWHADGAAVTFEDRENDQRLRVTTEWHGGWLDPLVDAYTDADADSAERRRPVGTLVDVCLVAVAADQHRHPGRP